MKKELVVIFGVLAVLSSLVSCEKCYECHYGDRDPIEYCSSDFNSRHNLNNFIDTLEYYGYECEVVK